MGKVCKRVRDTKSSMKNERAKNNYSKFLNPLAVTVKSNGNGKALGPYSFEVFEEKRDDVAVEQKIDDDIHAVCSPMRFMNAVPLRAEFSRTPRTPCKIKTNNHIGSPRTPCAQGRLSSMSHTMANLMRTPKTPCSKSRFQSSPSAVNNMLKTPKTPCSYGDSRLESLPIDILVKVLCHLHHDQLRPAFHVSKRVREAVQLARQFHFNFTTPDRSRQVLLDTTTPQPWDHWPFVNLNRNRNSMLKSCPKTPKAPRHSSRPPPKFDSTDVCPIDDALFQESAFPSRCVPSSSLTRSVSKSQLASNRVLFYSNDSNCSNSLL